MTDRTPFEKRTQEILEESSTRLDGRTLSRLNQARHAALDQLVRPERHWWRSYVPAGAAAVVAVLAVVMWTGQRPVDVVSVAQTPNAIDDMDILADADADAPDFVTDSEDVDFYEWAAGELES
jgi:anti-sigma-K factor RskA